MSRSDAEIAQRVTLSLHDGKTQASHLVTEPVRPSPIDRPPSAEEPW